MHPGKLPSYFTHDRGRWLEQGALFFVRNAKEPNLSCIVHGHRLFFSSAIVVVDFLYYCYECQ